MFVDFESDFEGGGFPPFLSIFPHASQPSHNIYILEM